MATPATSTAFPAPAPSAFTNSTNPASSTPAPTAPNTDDCPHSLLPPEPETTSEQLRPGQTSPAPLPPVRTADCGVSAPEGFRVDESVVGAAWIITDIDTGEIIAWKDPHGRYRPASIIKALLALVAIRDLDPALVITATREDAAMEGSAVGLGEGGHYSVTQLLQGLILASGNDAAHALATALGGEETTLTKINALATELGTTDTYAASYSGLDAAGMSTSAYDMALIYQAAFNNPVFAEIAATEHVDFPGYGDLEGYEVWNDNGLFMNDPDGIGGKTGFTDDAHHTFVGALNRDGRRLMAVILDTVVEGGHRSWQQAQALLHEAYAVPPGGGIGSLEPVAHSSSSPTPLPSPTPMQQESQQPVKTAPAQPDESYEWVGWVIISLTAALVVALTTFSLRPRRRQSGRGHRANRSRY
ncbi:D-alanyl-D-alanine carboxypeptidase [Corynebacterium phocae]|uniref:D-alanyl-D-alanine carboxypeptidase n=1 Tax=Corynebacterium phocae TaxID=161895 RepID=A0A1L7D6N1_9CORY|nr:D-alanyl-D-alanine carboxypeptidase [Corynebacterium phocae]